MPVRFLSDLRIVPVTHPRHPRHGSPQAGMTPRPRPKRHTASVWPKRAPSCCLSCRRTFNGNPRRGGIAKRHDPDYCWHRRVERER